MSDDQNLIKEVDEEIRQDNYKRAWSKYKKYFFLYISMGYQQFLRQELQNNLEHSGRNGLNRHLIVLNILQF